MTTSRTRASGDNTGCGKCCVTPSLAAHTPKRSHLSNLVGVLLHHVHSGADFRPVGKGNVGLLPVDN